MKGGARGSHDNLRNFSLKDERWQDLGEEVVGCVSFTFKVRCGSEP